MAIALSSPMSMPFGFPQTPFAPSPFFGESAGEGEVSPLMTANGSGRSPQLMTSQLPAWDAQGELQVYEGALQPGDSLNPTRFDRLKDDYILDFPQSSWVDVGLTSKQFDCYLQVIDPLTGKILAFDDDGGEGLNAQLRFQGEKGDRIILRASSYEAVETGDYRLTTRRSSEADAAHFPEASPLLPPTGSATPVPPPVEPSSPESSASEPSPLEPDSTEQNPSASPVSEPVEPFPVEPVPEEPVPEEPVAAEPVSEAPSTTQPETPTPSQPNDLPSLPRNFSILRGYGVVNAGAAIARIKGNPPPVPNPTNSPTTSNSPLQDIQASAAWAQGATGAGVVVAVIDSGLDLDHPELQGSIWRNPNEIPGDGIDNDSNGYIDDIHGWNLGLGQNNSDVRPGTDSSYQGHGTHVAGIIAAANDGEGNTGVAYDAKIMALRLGDATNRGTFRNAGNLIDAIYYAVNNGAQIINLSLGWSDSPELQTALAYAADNNVITVSAAGNSGNQSLPVAPARYADRWGISVGAIERGGTLATFSNQAGENPELRHVLAPGKRIRSSHPGNSYRRRSGTSMATPFVSGVVALMLSADPSLSPTQIRDILTATASDQPSPPIS